MENQTVQARAPVEGAWLFTSQADIPPRWRGRARTTWLIALTPEEMRRLLRDATLKPELSDADARVASLLAAGLPPPAIASRTGLSERTVHRRLAKLRELLGARSTIELGALLAKRGF